MNPPKTPPNTSVEVVCRSCGRAICIPMTTSNNRLITTPNVSVLAAMRVNEPTANAGMKPTDVHLRTERSIDLRSLHAMRVVKAGVISTRGTGTKSGLIRIKNGTINIPPPKPSAPVIVPPTTMRAKPPISSQIPTEPLCQTGRLEHVSTPGGSCHHPIPTQQWRSSHRSNQQAGCTQRRYRVDQLGNSPSVHDMTGRPTEKETDC